MYLGTDNRKRKKQQESYWNLCPRRYKPLKALFACIWRKGPAKLGLSATPQNFILCFMPVSDSGATPKHEHRALSNIWKTEFRLKYTCMNAWHDMYGVQRPPAQQFQIHTHTHVNLIKFKAGFLLKCQAAIGLNLKLYSSFSTSLQKNWNLLEERVIRGHLVSMNLREATPAVWDLELPLESTGKILRFDSN